MNQCQVELSADKLPLDRLSDIQLNDGCWLIETATPRLCIASSSFWKTLGYEDNDIKKKRIQWDTFFAPEQAEEFLSALLTFIKNPLADKKFLRETKFLRKDGPSVWMNTIGSITLDRNNNSQLIVAYTDITKYKKSEQLLQKKTALYEQLIDGTNTGTWQWNPQTEELRINRAWAAILGYTLEELTPTNSNTYRELTHPDDYEKSSKILQNHFEDNSPFYEFETRMKHKDGHWVWIRDKGKVISRSKDGSPEWVGGSHQEITQNKNDQLQLDRYKDLLERSNEAARIGSWEIDLINNNLSWCRVTKEIHEVDEAYIPDLESALNFYKKGASLNTITQAFQACTTQGQKYDVDIEISTAKGADKWVRAIGIPVMQDDKCVRVYGLFQDIDPITKAQKDLAFKEEQLRLTFKNAANGMALVALDGKWKMVNDSLCKILGYTNDELLQLKFQEITHPEDLSKDLQHIQELLQGTADNFNTEKRYFHKDGHIVWTYLAASIITNENNEPIHFVTQIIDISEKKIADKKVRALLDVTVEQNKRLLNFAHIVSHNLRSHSGNFLMLLSLMEEEIPSHTQNEYFPYLKGNAENLSETITSLNEVVKMSAHVNEKLKPVNLLTTVEEIIANLAPALLQPQFTITKNIDAHISAMVIPAYLESIILNLLTNAIKYRDPAREGQLQIVASVHQNTVTIDFKDNGLGIDMELYGSKIFGMYKTFHNNEDSQGIGLFITKNQMEAMGGTISVDSTVGSGTTFHLTLNSELTNTQVTS